MHDVSLGTIAQKQILIHFSKSDELSRVRNQFYPTVTYAREASQQSLNVASPLFGAPMLQIIASYAHLGYKDKFLCSESVHEEPYKDKAVTTAKWE